MNEIEIQRLAGAIAAMRPDWPAVSLRTFIANHLATRAYGDVAVAFAWVASRTTTQTPRLILEAGPWWQATAVERPEHRYRHPPRSSEACRDHPGEYDTHCRICNAPQVVDGAAKPARGRRSDHAAAHAEQARAALRAARHKPDPTREEPT